MRIRDPRGAQPRQIQPTQPGRCGLILNEFVLRDRPQSTLSRWLGQPRGRRYSTRLTTFWRSLQRSVYVAASRIVPGTAWIEAYAWYRAKVRNSPHQLVGAKRISKRLYRLDFEGGSSLVIVSPERIARYLGPNGLDQALDDVKRRYLPDDWEIRSEEGEIVDVGANIGEFALALLRKNSNLSITCFEPDPSVVPALEANLREYPNVRIVRSAVGATPGATTFYSSWRDADSSLVRPTTRSRSVTLDVVRLDDVMRSEGWRTVSLLKMDAEGGEPEALRGAAQLLVATALVAIDAGPERRGETTIDAVEEILLSSGLVPETDGPIVRAVRLR